MEHAREESRANLPSNTMVIRKEIFSPMLVLMMLMYPTLLGFVFLARMTTFGLLIPTPTVPGLVAGAPLSSDSNSGKLHGATDLWETAGAGALVRTGSAFTSIVVVHVFLVCYIIRGPSGASFMETHRNGDAWAFFASIAFWFITTCFLLTYTSMARYGAHGLEWGFAAFSSIMILVVTVLILCAPPYPEKVVVGYPPRAMV